MQKKAVQVYGVLVAILAILGFFIKDGHLFALMNADTFLDWLRLLLAAFLIYVGFRSDDAGLIRSSLVFVGVLYVALAILGLIDSKLWGLLPNGLTGFDILFHLATGGFALWAGLKKDTDRAVVRG